MADPMNNTTGGGSSLMGIIQQNLQQQPAKPQASEVNQTGQVQSLLAAKSGKAAPSTGPASGPRISNIAEQQAVQQAALAQAQLNKQGQVQAAQMGQAAQGQEQEIQQQANALTEQTASIEDSFNRNHAAILNEYTNGQKTLDMNKDKAKMEQVGFNIRLQNQEYITNLQREGARARLDNSINFKEELNRSVFAEEDDMFRDDLTFRSMLNSNQRDFNDTMNNIDVDFAVKMASMQNQAANQQMLWTGIGNLAGAGAAAAGNSKGSSTASTTAAPATTASTDTSGPGPGRM